MRLGEQGPQGWAAGVGFWPLVAMARVVAWLRNDLRLHDNAAWPLDSPLERRRRCLGPS